MAGGSPAPADTFEAVDFIRSGGIYHQHITGSADHYEDGVGGGGSLSFGPVYTSADSSTTADSFAKAEQWVDTGAVPPAWDKDRTVILECFLAADDAVAMAGTGQVGENNIGVKCEGTTVDGFTSGGEDGSIDGSSVQIASGMSSFTSFSVRIEYVAGERVTFYFDGSEAGEITTDLPTGDTAAQGFLFVYASNVGVSDDSELRLYNGSRVFQHP